MLNIKIKELRNQSGLTQAGLAKKLNVSQQTIGSWEVGRAEPNSDALNRLADLFNVTTDYLLGRNQTPEWAAKEDSLELDKILESNVGMAYGDEKEITKEDREQINDLIAGYFWSKKQREARKKNEG